MGFWPKSPVREAAARGEEQVLSRKDLQARELGAHGPAGSPVRAEDTHGTGGYIGQVVVPTALATSATGFGSGYPAAVGRVGADQGLKPCGPTWAVPGH